MHRTLLNKKFLLDANVLIDAKRRYYGFDLCPGFWDCLKVKHDTNNVNSIDKVKDELIHGKDDLCEWANNVIPHEFFKSTDDYQVITSFGDMMNWVYSNTQFSDIAKDEFARVADGWLVAFAKVNNFILVTQEEFAPEAKKRVPIPNVCKAFNVKHIDTFEMLKDLKARFVLDSGS